MSTSLTTARSGYNDSFLGQNRTPIHFAAYQGQLHALYGLIKLGKNVNSRTVDGVTPLHEACSRGNFYCAKMLIQAGAEVNVRNIDGSSPLGDAACNGSLDCINLLLDSGVLVNDPMARSTPLHEAALRDHWAAVTALINAGCKLEASDGHFGTPLHAACFKGNVASALQLVLAGANVNATKLHESPLHLAAAAGSLLLVKILIEFGANLNQRDNRGRRPIDLVISDTEMYKLLKQYETDVLSLQDSCRMTIHRHVKRGNTRDLVNVGLPVPLIDRLLYRGPWAP
ncbi:putative ankyrin repeat and SOCS box protein 13 [Apostichopus japonicus]|uniref:Putative ankyrin repeat and SOCS box protein 13 n=1 Tax=Stichopus japonicus TaxID=307972 RepID=A0A2G8KR37_STIJA|nr:putative ankyrin repeat and SOCS box protein 13 [Apostichopus japonicus]